VWIYHRFTLSFRDIEDLLAERGVIVSYESIRQWYQKFRPDFAKRLRNRQGKLGDTWYADEVFIKINGELRYLWRAVDQDGDVLDIIVQRRRDKRAALSSFRKMLKAQGSTPRTLVTDKLRSYGAARKELIPSVVHSQDRYVNIRAEVSH